MPCNSDYMEAGGDEVEISQVACLLDELNGKKKIDESHWRGYHPRIYNKLDEKLADKLTSKLCSELQKVNDITKYSLEMQIWWRDHQKADKKRIEEEKEDALRTKLATKAIKKLTREEREVLGIEEP